MPPPTPALHEHQARRGNAHMPREGNEVAIRCRSVWVSYGARSVLRDLDLEVPEGSRVAIMGPSGSGKTTLLHVLAGIVAPAAGEVVVAGVDLMAASPRQRAKHRQRNVAMVFQFGELLPELTVAENVTLPLRIRGDRPHKGAAVQALAEVGFGEPEASPGRLSGGETQRVAVARALVTNPRILLCDEPTGSLDAASSDALIDLILSVATRTEKTLVVATHDREIAQRMDKTLLLTNGHLTPT